MGATNIAAASLICSRNTSIERTQRHGGTDLTSADESGAATAGTPAPK